MLCNKSMPPHLQKYLCKKKNPNHVISIKKDQKTVIEENDDDTCGEYSIITGKHILIVCFGGMALQMGGVPPFEFLRHLQSHYNESCDLLFYVDRKQCWYHHGIQGVSTNIEETVKHLSNKIQGYKKVVFMGVSAGGYASILFGSLCNVSNVVAFVPRTNLLFPVNPYYKNLKNFININTNYILYGDTSIKDKNDNHHISQCENICGFPNVCLIRKEKINMKKLRDEGHIKLLLDNILFSSNN